MVPHPSITHQRRGRSTRAAARVAIGPSAPPADSAAAANAPAPLTLAVQDAADASVVRVAGELDLTGSDALLAALVRTRGRRVTVQLADLAFIDARGLRAFVAARRALESGGRELVLADPSPFVARVFALAGLDALLGPSLAPRCAPAC